MKKILFSLLIIIGFLVPDDVSSQSLMQTDYNSYHSYTRISFGGGVNINFYSKGYTNFLFSLQVIPQLSERLFLSFRLDAHKLLDYNITAVILSVSPMIDFELYKSKLFLYLGGGRAYHFYGKRGGEASFMPSLKLEYSINKLIELGIESRKPIFFQEDSGHNQILLSLNFNFKF